MPRRLHQALLAALIVRSQPRVRRRLLALRRAAMWTAVVVAPALIVVTAVNVRPDGQLHVAFAPGADGADGTNGNASLVAKDLQHDHPLSRLARAFEGRSGRGYVASLLTESQRALISIVDHTYVSRLTNDCRYEESLFEVTAGSGSGSEVTKCAEAFPGVVHTNVDELYGMVDFTSVTAGTIAVLRAMHEDAEMPEAVITESRSIDRLTVRSVVDENFNVESEVSSDRAA